VVFLKVTQYKMTTISVEIYSEKYLIFWELFLPDLRLPTAPDLLVPLFFIFDFLVFSFISFGFVSFGFISFG
jgi:hypothetical protein